VKTAIKIHCQKLIPKTKDALSHFSPETRRYFTGSKSKSKCFQKDKGFSVPLSEFDNEQKIAQTIWNNYGSGEFNVFGFGRNKRTKTQIGNVKLCHVTLHDLGDGKFSYQVDGTWRLRQRYAWFYRGK